MSTTESTPVQQQQFSNFHSLKIRLITIMMQPSGFIKLQICKNLMHQANTLQDVGEKPT